MNQTVPSRKRGSARLGFVGDLILGRDVSAKLTGGFPPAALWGDVRPHLLATDAMIGNLEGPITTHDKRWPRLKSYYFRADPLAVEALTAGNFHCLALANNHMLDFQGQGIADTRRHLARAGIAHAGAGESLAEAAEPAIFTAGDARIGFVSITDTIAAFAARHDRPGTHHWRIRPSPARRERLAAHVADLRRRGANLLILSIHWGPNYRWWPPRRYRAFARAAIDLGFDIVHGHSAHILQAAEFHGDGLILYDTGDFIHDIDTIDRAVHWLGVPNQQSCLFVVEARPNGPPGLTMIPVTLDVGLVSLARGAEAAGIRQRMIHHSRDYAIAFAEDGETLVGRPPRADHATAPGAYPPSASTSSTANNRNR